MLRSILRLPTPSFLAQRHLTSVTTAPTKQEEPLAGQLFYPDPYVRDILATTQTIAVIGASTNPSRPSYFAMKYLQAKGFKIVPINPGAAGQTILGEVVHSDLQSLPKDLSIDMVDVFRRSEDTLEYARQAKDIGAKHLWLQLGVVNHDTRRTAEAEGLTVIMDRCPKIEFARLFGELGWLGVDTKVISSKKRKVISGQPKTLPPGKGKQPVFKGFDTRCIHAGATPCPSTGARVTPIYQNTAYVFDDVEHGASLFDLQAFGNIYSRLSNPTTAVLEERISSLEGGRGTTCTASGHSAQLLALFPLMSPGDTMVASNKLYGGSLTQFGKTFKKFGWKCIFVDVSQPNEVIQAMESDANIKCLWTESIANPGGNISDLSVLSTIAHSFDVPFIVDNTLATPYLCKPFEHGADLIVHSTTKFLSGHGNAMGGAVVDSGTFDWAKVPHKFPSLTEPEDAYHGLKFYETFGDLTYTLYCHAIGLRDLGPTMAPQNAFLTITGIETLPLRMEKHCHNAMVIAEWLEQDDRIKAVSYAGLNSSTYKTLANNYMKNGGAGSVFTFEIDDAAHPNLIGSDVVERCELFSLLANVGDTRSLILHPASTTHRQLTAEQREQAGAGDNVIRLSIGIENAEDLISDLDYALG